MTPVEARIADPAFADWLGGRLATRGAVRVAAVSSPSGGGWSNQTFFVDLADAGAATTHQLVVKMAPTRLSMFRIYDLSREHLCLSALAGGWPPVPKVVGHDWEGGLLGGPFYVMRRVAGEVPADDRPAFSEAGFLFEAAPAVQRAVHDEMIRALAALHALDPGAAGLAALARETPGTTHLARELAWLEDLFRWGGGPAPQPVIEAGFARAWEGLPNMADAGLVWGDARPANMVLADFRIAALLDWELATLGPGELDLFWFLEMNAMRARGRPLPGFRDEADAVALYERETGRAVREADWFRHFSALKIAVLMLRHLLQRVDAGLLPADHSVLTDNVSLRRLAALG
jgi:aminoglycoside phosphotransferase (APT) family kinase protein